MEETRRKPPSDAALKLRAFLQTPEGIAKITELNDKIAAEKKAHKEFFETPEFNALYERILAEVGDETAPEPGTGVTDDEYDRFWSCLQRQKDPASGVHEVIPKPLPAFPFTAYRYKELVVETLYGQGTITYAYRATKKNHRRR